MQEMRKKPNKLVLCGIHNNRKLKRRYQIMEWQMVHDYACVCLVFIAVLQYSETSNSGPSEEGP
jgi:hypothetical protein